jgi:hypothetical protein
VPSRAAAEDGVGQGEAVGRDHAGVQGAGGESGRRALAHAVEAGGDELGGQEARQERVLEQARARRPLVELVAVDHPQYPEVGAREAAV